MAAAADKAKEDAGAADATDTAGGIAADVHAAATGDADAADMDVLADAASTA